MRRGGPMAVRGTRTAGGKAPDGFLDRRHCSEINADFVQLKVDVILAGGRGKGNDIQDGWRPVRNRCPRWHISALLQIRHRGEVELTGHDEARAAPVRAEPTRIDPGDVPGEPGRMVAGEG